MKFLMIFVLSLSAFGSGDHHHTQELTLSDSAVKNFGIECAPYQKENFPESSVVRSGHESSIFKCHGKSFSSIHLDDVHPGDRVVVKGANFLKTVELSNEEGPAKGHSH